MEAFLHSEGYQVVSATSGKEAIEEVRRALREYWEL